MWVDAHSRRFRHRTWSFGQACSSCQRSRVLQSAKPKEAVVKQELLEFVSHEVTKRSLAGGRRKRAHCSLVQILSGLSHEERELEKRRGPGRGERAHRPSWLDAVKRQAAPNVTHMQ